ncbi:MAG TPA: transporter [Flavobacteriales bacterium]|nr:transporter [Flavobacteriales bacterium]HIO72556.1 transporter [Flavobacteriales bacterium]
MIRRATTLISVLCLLSLSSYSQTSKSIVSGRPGQAIAPVCVGKNVFQIETGFDFTGTSSPSGVYMAPEQEFLNQSQSYLNATLLRFGLGERVEMHSGWEFRNDDYSLVDTLGAAQNSSVGGISFSSVGWRFTILEGEGLKPSVAYQFSMKLNILTEVYKLSQVAPNMNVAASSNITDNLTITINMGADWDGENPRQTAFYIFNVGYSLGDKFGIFVENYGSFGTELLDIKYDGGIAFLINNDLQLDLLGGYGSYKGTTSWFASLGISWRVNFSEKKAEPPKTKLVQPPQM